MYCFPTEFENWKVWYFASASFSLMYSHFSGISRLRTLSTNVFNGTGFLRSHSIKCLHERYILFLGIHFLTYDRKVFFNIFRLPISDNDQRNKKNCSININMKIITNNLSHFWHGSVYLSCLTKGWLGLVQILDAHCGLTKVQKPTQSENFWARHLSA